MLPELFQVVVPVANDKLPLMLRDPEPANVTDPADTVIFKHLTVPSAPEIVTVYVVAWSKNTLSADVGTLAPPAPPEVVDQGAVPDVAVHAAVPPTQ